MSFCKQTYNQSCATTCDTSNCFSKCQSASDCGIPSHDFICCGSHCYSIRACPSCCYELCNFSGTCAECFSDRDCELEYRCTARRCYRGTSHIDLGILIGLGFTLILILVLLKLARNFYRKWRRRNHTTHLSMSVPHMMSHRNPVVFPTSRSSRSNTDEQDLILSSNSISTRSPSALMSGPPPTYSEAQNYRNPVFQEEGLYDEPPPYNEAVGSPLSQETSIT